MMGRINGTQPVLRLKDEMDRLFNNLVEGALVRGPVPFLRRGGFPAINIWEDDRNLFAEAELPGFKMEELEVLMNGLELTIKGHRTDQPHEGATFHRRERAVGEFTRSITLPLPVETEKVQAALRDGVLTITLPKAQEVLPRKIKVQS
jgi:HSP20 family protein